MILTSLSDPFELFFVDRALTTAAFRMARHSHSCHIRVPSTRRVAEDLLFVWMMMLICPADQKWWSLQDERYQRESWAAV